MTRYRIQDRYSGRVWDSTNRRWVAQSSGDYNTYKSFNAAISAARRTRNDNFRIRDKEVVEDREF